MTGSHRQSMINIWPNSASSELPIQPKLTFPPNRPYPRPHNLVGQKVPRPSLATAPLIWSLVRNRRPPQFAAALADFLPRDRLRPFACDERYCIECSTDAL
jgi:hypothetical protein